MGVTREASRFELTDDQIDYLTGILDLQTWPAVLSVATRHDVVDERARAWAVAASGLRAAGHLMDDLDPVAGVAVADALAEVMAILSEPEVLLEMRCHRASSTGRFCLARRGDRHVLASRTTSGLALREVAIGSGAEVGRIIAQLVEPAEPASVGPASVPADELQRCLDGAQCAADYADALHALGIAAVDAGIYAVAFDTCLGHTEIVAIDCAPGRMRRSAGAVAVYDTARGRIVAGPSMSPDGRIWSTLSPGTGHRISQAVTLLLETLPSGRWLP